MEPEPIDLSPLALPAHRRERLIGAVLARARVGVVPRTPLSELAAWARPTLAAAAVVAALSLGLLTRSGPAAAAEPPPLTLADALSIPEPASDWVAENRPPTEEDLLAQWDEDMTDAR
ncbi:MAG TPA: hypothetical protein VEY93_11480 [Longimicrobium sp.]|nr:hypothetical protein [Longimicrobium sp.]